MVRTIWCLQTLLFLILLEEAFSLLNSMSDEGLRPGLFTYNTMINGLSIVENYGRWKEVLDEMFQVRLVVEKIMF